MRTPVLAGLLAVLSTACIAGEIEDVGGNGDGMAAGSQVGSGSGSGNGTQDMPRVDLTVDKNAVTTDLNVESTITITATAAMGFAGDVTLAVSAVDSANAAIADWTTTLATKTLTLPANGTMTTTLTVSALGDTAALAGNLRIAATSSAGPAETTVAVTFNPVLAVTFNDNGNGNCVYPVNRGPNNPWRLKTGRTIKVINGSSNLGLQVHTNNIAGFPHQNNVAPPGGSYTGTVTRAGDVSEFYCHTGDDTMTEGNGSVRNLLRVVQ